MENTFAAPQKKSNSHNCPAPYVIRKGFFRRKCDSKKVQKFLCKGCGLNFSSQTLRDTYRLRRVRIISPLRRLLCSGVSQRRSARILGITRRTVGRVIDLLAVRSEKEQTEFVHSLGLIESLQFDEMETFEHTKCKPLSIPLVVTPSRHIIAIDVASMPAKGMLAKISREKYGPRRDDRSPVISSILSAVKSYTLRNCKIITDKNPHYPKHLSNHFPDAQRLTTLGGRGCIVGYGEIKQKSFDPMFALNHTAAMLRDGLATLKRRTWTTVKKPENLAKLLMIYTVWHNKEMVGQP